MTSLEPDSRRSPFTAAPAAVPKREQAPNPMGAGGQTTNRARPALAEQPEGGVATGAVEGMAVFGGG
jgi:hypothetical protein